MRRLSTSSRATGVDRRGGVGHAMKDGAPGAGTARNSSFAELETMDSMVAIGRDGVMACVTCLGVATPLAAGYRERPLWHDGVVPDSGPTVPSTAAPARGPTWS